MAFDSRGTEWMVVVLLLSLWTLTTTALMRWVGEWVVWVSLGAFGALLVTWAIWQYRDRRKP